MSALKFATLCAVMLAAPGCALINAISSGDPAAAARAAAAEADRAARLGKDATDYAETTCAPVLKSEVGYAEERAIGGVIGVELVSSSGHLFLDGVSEKSAETMNEKLARGEKVALPDNAINDLTAYVSIVGKNLARYSARPDLPWTFAVIKNDAVNAFSAPGGYVVVTTALLKKVQNEAQLAGVLGHEIGHVVHKHSLKKYRDAKHKQCIAANYTARAIENGLVPNTPVNAEAAKYARKFDGTLDLDKEKDVGFIKGVMNFVIKLLQSGNDAESEFETDKTALELVAFAGYDAQEYGNFLKSLGNQGGGLFPSHPSTGDRAAKLDAQLKGELAPFATGTAKPDMTRVLAPLSAAK